MSDLASVWGELTDVQRAHMSELVAGKRQGNIVMAMMSNYKDMQDSLTTALNSTNSALIENDKYMESIQAKQEMFKNTVMGKWQEALDSSVIKGFVVAMTNLVEVLGNLNTVLALSTTAFLLWKGQAILGSITALTTFIATESMATVSTVALTGSVGLLTKAFNTLKLAIATNPIGLLAVGITSVIIAFNSYTNHVKKVREENEKLIETTQSQVQSLKSQKDGLQALSAEYETLKGKEDSLTATIDDKKRLLEIQKELVTKYGVSATGINLEGEAYSDSIEAIKLRTLALEKEIEKEKERLELSVLSADAINTEDIENNTKKKYTTQKKIETAKKALPYLEENDPYAANLKKEQIKQFEKDIEEANLIIQNASKNRQKYLEYDAQETIKSLESNGRKMSDSAKLVVSEFAKSLALQPESLENQQESLQKFINKISNSDLDELIEKYNKFTFDINNGDDSNKNIDGLEKTSVSIIKLINSLTKSDPNLKEFAINFASLYPPTITAKQAIESFNDSAKDLDFLEITDKIQFLQKTLQELSSADGLSSSSKEKIIEEYPQLFAYMNDEIELRKQLQTIIEESEQQQINAFLNTEDVNGKTRQVMLETDEAFFNNVIKGNSDVWNLVKLAYGTDLSNFNTIAKLKDETNKLLIKALGADWAQFYGSQEQALQQIVWKAKRMQDPTKQDWEFANKAQAELDAVSAMKKAMEIDVGSKLKSVNLGDVKSSSSSSSSKDTYISDQYAISTAKLDAELKSLEYTKSKLSQTSEEYRNILQQEINIFQQKQQLAHEEANRLRTLQSQVAKNTKEYDEYTKSIQSLGDSWIDLQSKIDDTKAFQFTSKVGELDNIIGITDDKLKHIKTQLNHLTSGTELYNAKLQDQVVATKENIDALKDKQALYLKEIALEKDNIARKDELIEKLEEINDIIYETQIGAIELQRQLEMVELETERTAQKNASDKRIQSIQDEIDAINKENDALERQEQISNSILAISESQLKIAEAQKDLTDARNKLENVKNEKNIRQFEDGIWSYVADQSAVKSAEEEVDDALKNLKNTHNASLEAQQSYNNLMNQMYLDDLQARINEEKKKQEAIDKSFDEQEKARNEYYDQLILVIPVQGAIINNELGKVIDAIGITFDTKFSEISSNVIRYIRRMKAELKALEEESGINVNALTSNNIPNLEGKASGGYIPNAKAFQLHPNEYVLNSNVVNALGGKSGVESMIASLRFPELMGANSMRVSNTSQNTTVDKGVTIQNLNLPNVLDVGSFVRNMNALART